MHAFDEVDFSFVLELRWLAPNAAAISDLADLTT